MLHHSLVDTVSGSYHDFGQIGVASLLMVAQNNNIDITSEQAKTAIVTPLLTLPPHSDVKEGLAKLKAQGYKLVSLTNSSNKGVKAQFESAGLMSYLTHVTVLKILKFINQTYVLMSGYLKS